MTTEAMRAQFETWVTKQSWFVACLGLTMIHDAYIDPCVNSRWQGYQAALRSPATVGLVEAARKVERRLIPLMSGKLQDVNHADFVAFFAALANLTGDKP